MPTDLTIYLDDHPGELARMANVLGASGVNILGFCAVTSGGGKAEVHVLVDDMDPAFAALAAASIVIANEQEVAVVPVDDHPGVLGEVSRRLGAARLRRGRPRRGQGRAGLTPDRGKSGRCTRHRCSPTALHDGPVDWTLAHLDFPVLLLRDDRRQPALTGLAGGDGGGLYDVTVGYGQRAEMGAWLSLRTVARRGHRVHPGGRTAWVSTELPDIARLAITDLLLADIPNGMPKPELRRLAEQRIARGKGLAESFPRDRWATRSVDIDQRQFVLWLLELETGFAAVADYGPVMLAASGTEPGTWSWQLTAAPPDAARSVLTGAPA
jgi:hypothetical protein